MNTVADEGCVVRDGPAVGIDDGADVVAQDDPRVSLDVDGDDNTGAGAQEDPAIGMGSSRICEDPVLTGPDP